MMIENSDKIDNQTAPATEPSMIHRAAELYASSTILVVDDNPTNLTVISDYLEEYGFEIIVARNGETALQRAEYVLPDIILLDVMMPGMDGFETCRRLKRNEATQDIPIIFMTALADVQSKVKGFEAGAVDYVTKPLQHQEVLVRITTHLRNRDLTRNLRKQNMRLELSWQVAQRVASILDLDDLLLEIVHLIQDKFGYYFVGVWLLTAENDRLTLQACAGQAQPLFKQGYTISLDESTGIIAWVCRSGHHYLANDVSQDRRYVAVQGLAETQAELSLPLRIGSDLLGVLDIQSDRTAAFDFEDRMMLQTLADQMAIVIRNAQLYARQKELRHLEEEKAQELFQLNAAKDKFFSIVAHDLKGPFQPLLGFSKLLLRIVDTATPEQLTEIGEGIYRSARNIYNLLENLLQWSRIQMDRLDYEPNTLDLREVVGRNIKLLKESAVNKNVDLQSTVTDPILVRADENMLDTVIRNLTSNALKFTPEGGQVTISAHYNGSATDRTPAEFVEVSISDTGVGISQENIAKLFRMDAHHSTLGTAKEQGTGLGLLICKEMVEKNGGVIWIESKQEQGTTVRFTTLLDKVQQF